MGNGPRGICNRDQLTKLVVVIGRDLPQGVFLIEQISILVIRIICDIAKSVSLLGDNMEDRVVGSLNGCSPGVRGAGHIAKCRDAHRLLCAFARAYNADGHVGRQVALDRR